MMSVCTACSQANTCAWKMEALIAFMDVSEGPSAPCSSAEMDHAIKVCETAGVGLPQQTSIDCLLAYLDECCERDDPASIVKIFDPSNQIFTVNRYDALSAKDKDTVQEGVLFGALTSILWKPDEANVSLPIFMNASVNNTTISEQLRSQLQVTQDALKAETIADKVQARCIYMYV